MRHSSIAGLTALILLATLAESAAPAGAAKESERYGYRTYRERSGGVTVLADTTIAQHDPGASYTGFAIAVRLAARTPNVTVSRESFTLIDSGGNRVPAAGAMEIRREHSKVGFDMAVMRSQRMTIGQQFSGDIRVPSQFYGDGNATGIVQDHVNLAPSSWFCDIIYFPRPPAGLDGTLTLRVEGGGLQAPIEVRFPVLEPAPASRASM